MKIPDRFLHIFNQKKILVAVSGGMDSVVLLDILSGNNLNLVIAHANFQLRGKESDEDEEFVRQLASLYSKPIFVRRFSTNNYAIEKKIGIQVAARDLRYSWFDEVMKEEGCEILVTAHHLNDSLETAVHHFIRGTSISGLTGIAEINNHKYRPFLEFSRTEIRKYAVEKSLSWREDSSNATDNYTRNFIRHRIIPVMKEINPSMENTFFETSQRLNGANELMLHGLTQLSEKYVLTTSDGLIIQKSLLMLFRHPAAILWELIKAYGFNFSQCNDITSALSGQPGKVFLTDQYRLTIDRDVMIIDRGPGTLLPVEITLENSSADLGEHRLILSPDKGWPEQSTDSSTAILDLGKLTFPLTWRAWRPGDFFYPSGMNHRKKISDFLIDKKIPANEKDRITILESNDAIVWVVGHRVDERFKANPKTQAVLLLKLE